MQTTVQIARFIRWRDWLPRTFSLVWLLSIYFVIAYEVTPIQFAMTFVVFSAFAFSQATLAYVLNEWSDQAFDRRQFKANAFNGLSHLERKLALALVVILAIVSGMPLILRPGFLLLWLVWAAGAACLSLEPFRMKTRGAAGLFFSVIAQWFLPVLLAFAAFQVAGGADMWILAVAFTLHGVAIDIGRQRSCRERNIHAHAHTLAVGLSDLQVDRLYTFALLLDKWAIGAIVGLAIFTLWTLGTPLASYLAIFLLALAGLLFLAILRSLYYLLLGRPAQDPYFSIADPLTRLAHNVLLEWIIPVAFGVASTLVFPDYGLFLGLMILLGVSMLDWRPHWRFPDWARQVIRRRNSRSD